MKKQLEQIAAEFWQKVKNNEYSIVKIGASGYFNHLKGKHNFFTVLITVGDFEEITLYIRPNELRMNTDIFGCEYLDLCIVDYTPEWYEFLTKGVEEMELLQEENHKQFKIKNDL
jgi:hypothetical protein